MVKKSPNEKIIVSKAISIDHTDEYLDRVIPGASTDTVDPRRLMSLIGKSLRDLRTPKDMQDSRSTDLVMLTKYLVGETYLIIATEQGKPSATAADKVRKSVRAMAKCARTLLEKEDVKNISGIDPSEFIVTPEYQLRLFQSTDRTPSLELKKSDTIENVALSTPLTVLLPELNGDERKIPTLFTKHEWETIIREVFRELLDELSTVSDGSEKTKILNNARVGLAGLMQYGRLPTLSKMSKSDGSPFANGEAEKQLWRLSAALTYSTVKGRVVEKIRDAINQKQVRADE